MNITSPSQSQQCININDTTQAEIKFIKEENNYKALIFLLEWEKKQHKKAIQLLLNYITPEESKEDVYIIQIMDTSTYMEADSFKLAEEQLSKHIKNIILKSRNRKHKILQLINQQVANILIGIKQ